MTPPKKAESPKPWPNKFETARDVAEGCNWLRWKTGDRAIIVLAIGRNSVSAALSPAVDVEEAIHALATEIDTLSRLLRDLRASNLNYAAVTRPDGR